MDFIFNSICYHEIPLVSGQRQSLKRDETLYVVSQCVVPLKMRLFVIITVGVIGIRSKPVSEDFEDISFNEEEFQYFYNLELVQELTASTEETKPDATQDSGNGTRVDQALSKLEEEGELIEKVLNEIEFKNKNVLLQEEMENEIDFSASLLYEIFYWIFLASFLLMLGLSVVMTGKYFIENPKNGSPSTHRRADLEFDFFTA